MTCAYAIEEDETKIAMRVQPSSSPFMFVPQPSSDNPNSVDIMGFVSVQTEDRDGEIFAPETFNKAQFLSVAGPLFVNHKAWMDDNGNPVSAGKVNSLHVVRVRNSKTQKGALDVVDVERRRVIAIYPKDHAPEIKPGTKGLFTRITVTEPAVVKQVRDGQLKAFSWRGQAIRDTQFDMQRGRTLKTASHIDLWEISLVNIPSNPDASFMVEKGRLIGIAYPEDTSENGLDFFVSHAGIAKSAIVRDEKSGKLVVRFREKSRKPDSVVVVKSAFGDELVLDCSTKLTGACDMASETATVPEEQTVDEIISQAVEKSVAATEPLINDVAELKGVVASQNETIVALGKSIEAMNQSLTDVLAKAAAPAPAAEAEKEDEEEVEKTAETSDESASQPADVLKGFQDAMADLTKSLQGIVSRHSEREEEISKGADKEDPYACFDSLFVTRN